MEMPPLVTSPVPPPPVGSALTLKEITDLYAAIGRVQQQMALAEDHLIRRIDEVYKEATATIKRVMATVPHQFIRDAEGSQLFPTCQICGTGPHAVSHAR